jgi:protein-L-isoaspartate(D-aspartate) O-methyltransferase
MEFEPKQLAIAKHRLIERIRERGTAPRVVEAMQRVHREDFVPPSLRLLAYRDKPLPIGYEQTISQPSLVAFMTDTLRVTPDDIVLEIGTGSGYQAAILACLARRVYTVELVEPLAFEAAERLQRLGYTNVEVLVGDGYDGWPEHAPYRAICVTASATEVPQKLVAQLADGGRMIIPVGEGLRLLTKTGAGELRDELLEWVSFVPLVHAGAARAHDREEAQGRDD